jgi:hypothetical protein
MTYFVRWKDRSTRETGFKVYVRLIGDHIGPNCSGMTERRTLWKLVATVGANEQSWRGYSLSRLWALFNPDFAVVQTQVAVAAYNEAGDSARAGPVDFEGDLPSCIGP